VGQGVSFFFARRFSSPLFLSIPFLPVDVNYLPTPVPSHTSFWLSQTSPFTSYLTCLRRPWFFQHFLPFRIIHPSMSLLLIVLFTSYESFTFLYCVVLYPPNSYDPFSALIFFPFPTAAPPCEILATKTLLVLFTFQADSLALH